MEHMANIVQNSVEMGCTEKSVRRNVHPDVTKPVIKYLDPAQAMVQVTTHLLPYPIFIVTHSLIKYSTLYEFTDYINLSLTLHFRLISLSYLPYKIIFALSNICIVMLNSSYIQCEFFSQATIRQITDRRQALKENQQASQKKICG